ncbi:hypothetical protein CRG98_000767 [Punica granatum]|uniref:Uncharacterized protein n=1 Tax=Punica granatum TaxID=22663 RepID=A0A2I0LDU1_PUNGR|nr:hypothetical protein CRG98_000767 [Punica granatum]
MTFRNSTGFPEERFSGHKRLPANLRGTFMENRDHNDPRTPRDTRETLRKPRSRVPRSSPANGLRLGTASQPSRAGQKAHRDKHYNAQRSNRRTGMVNSSLNAQTGQNRLSRRRVTRTFVHMTYGNIRLIQILFVQSNGTHSSAKPSYQAAAQTQDLGSTPSHGSIPQAAARPQLAAANPSIRWLQVPPTTNSNSSYTSYTSITSYHPSITLITSPLASPTL